MAVVAPVRSDQNDLAIVVDRGCQHGHPGLAALPAFCRKSHDLHSEYPVEDASFGGAKHSFVKARPEPDEDVFDIEVAQRLRPILRMTSETKK